MNKKIVSVALCVLIALGSLCVNAAVEYTPEFAKSLFKGLDIMSGDEKGNLNLDSYLTRAEFAKIAINSSKYKNTVAHGAKVSVFQDCTYTHWAAPYVKVAVTNKVITGYPDGTFKPNNTVNLEETVTVMLRLLGYTDEDFGSSWPYGQINLAENLGITDNVYASVGEAVTREDALKIVYNTLNTFVKDTDREYCEEIDVSLYDDVIVIATNNEDSSIAYGKVLTSAGTFRCDEEYISEYIGVKGSLAVKSNNTVLCFSKDEGNIYEYVVYSVLSDSMVVYDSGSITELKLSANTPVYSGSDKLTFASAKDKVAIGDVIRVVKTKSGNVDYLTLFEDSLDGPYVLYNYTDNWFERFSDDSSGVKLVRNGEKTALSSVKVYDVLYYSRELNTVFAYTKAVTGVYEEAIPNKDAPTAVVVSGTQYEIESADAFSKLSSMGDLSFGSSVTLLLGKDSKIADVISSDKAQNISDIVGYLTQTGKKQFDKDGETYTSRYVSLIMPDGTTREYKTNSDYASLINSVVKVSFSGEYAKLSYATSQEVYGRVDADNSKIGKTYVSNDIEILDVSTTRSDYKGTAVKTYMERLDGIELSASSILWCKKNASGEITRLILKDVTGDSAVYGIVTDINSPSSGGGFSSGTTSYTMDSAGTQYNFSGGKFANLSNISPVKMVVSGNQVQTISALAKLSGKLNGLTEYSITLGSAQYLLSDDVVVYRKISYENYSVMTLSELLENYQSYSISAYHDKAQSNGGRVRVLIVQ